MPAPFMVSARTETDAPDGGMTFVLPDTVRGYEADSEWHNAALYEDAPAQTGKEARP